VQAEPVVRKDLVGQLRASLSCELMHAHTRARKRKSQRVELALRAQRGIALRVRRRVLEEI
jgi:hypothetical protein